MVVVDVAVAVEDVVEVEAEDVGGAVQQVSTSPLRRDQMLTPRRRYQLALFP